MNISNGDFTRAVSVIFIALTGVVALVIIALIIILKLPVNPALFGVLGGIISATTVFFAKASGVSQGSAIVSDAVQSVSDSINNATLSTPPTLTQVPYSVPVSGSTQPSIPVVQSGTPPVA